MEVDTEKAPAEGEILIFTPGGGFLVRGTMQEVVTKLRADEWVDFELVESGDHVVVRSDQVVALRAGARRPRGTIGFVHRD